MSNPVTHADVEDVLASIRRLVSEDRRPVRPASEASEIEIDPTDPAITRSAIAEPGKLVLTPSLRVNPAADGAPELTEASGFNDTPTPYVLQDDDAYDASWGLEPESPAPSDIAAEATDSPDAPTEQDESARDPQADLAEAYLAADAQDDAATAENHDAEVIDTVTELFRRDAAEVQRDVEAADVPQDPAQDAMPDAATAEGAEPVEESSTLLRRVTFRHERSDTADAGAETAAADEESLAQDSASTEADGDADHTAAPQSAEKTWVENRAARQMALGAKIAALEAVVGRREDQWEPDGVDSDAYSGTAQATPMSWDQTDDAEPDSDAQDEALDTEAADHQSEDAIQPVEFRHAQDPDPVPEGDEAVEDDAVEEMSDDTKDMMDQVAAAAVSDVLDHATLREIVSEALREELQGELGERITRNVRKLVRREIYRAMASREFE